MKAIYWEMRKSLFRLPVLIVLIVFSLLDIFRISEVYSIFGRFSSENTRVIRTAYYDFYDELKGTVSNENIEILVQKDKELTSLIMSGEYSREYDPKCFTGYEFGDFALFHFNIVPEVRYYLTYPNYSNEIVRKADENISFFKSKNADYQAKYNDLIRRMYSGRNISEYRLTEWAGFYFSYDFSSLLAMIILVFGLCSSFTAEKESGMTRIICSVGKIRDTTFSKVVAAAVYSSAITLWFSALDLTVMCISFGIDGLNMPVYSAEYFKDSPYSFSFITAIIVCGVLRFASLVVVSLTVLLISEISPNTIVSGIVSFAFIIVLILSAGYFPSVLNPVLALTQDSYIKTFDCINLFGNPVPQLYIAALTLLMMSIALTIIIVSISAKSMRKSNV